MGKKMRNETESSDSEYDTDGELQETLANRKLQPGLFEIQTQKVNTNDVKSLKLKLEEFNLSLPWIETLVCINKQAPLAPELAAQLLVTEQKRENEIKNNKKLPQITTEDPVLNDFKREMIFHRQGQATVMEAIPKLKEMGLSTKRPDDYFAEMAKTDEHMQKIREKLLQRQAEQQRSERVRQLRKQRKEGKALQVQARLQRQQEKKEILDKVKKVRKGASKDLSFLEGKKFPRKGIDHRKKKDKKFGFGGKKKGLKLNTKDSSADISEYKNLAGKQFKKGCGKSRPGKNRRIKNKNRKK